VGKFRLCTVYRARNNNCGLECLYFSFLFILNISIDPFAPASFRVVRFFQSCLDSIQRHFTSASCLTPQNGELFSWITIGEPPLLYRAQPTNKIAAFTCRFYNNIRNARMRLGAFRFAANFRYCFLHKIFNRVVSVLTVFSVQWDDSIAMCIELEKAWVEYFKMLSQPSPGRAAVFCQNSEEPHEYKSATLLLELTCSLRPSDAS
jgi:hypothetical protein